MKQTILTGLLLLGTLSLGRAAIYYQGTGVTGDVSEGSVANSTIVDGNPTYVIANTMDLSSAGLGASLSDITVTLNVSGGMNNGLYAYLVGPKDTTVTLLNQPGVGVNGYGATGAGMNITLSDAGSTSIQNETSGSVLSGTYQAAGSLSALNGNDPNGTWTLYFSDTLAGGGNSTLNGWSLDITAVPEPVNVALSLFAGAVILIGGIRWQFRRNHLS
jgi:hypothetical protein